jgi:hypothetical protein
MNTEWIGIRFTKRSKANKGRVYTVIDELTTTNRAGAIVKVEFLCEHEFLGQKVKSWECSTTIKMGMIA